MGRQVHKGERKPPGFWTSPQVQGVFSSFVAGKIGREEAYRRLGITHYGEAVATGTFNWYLQKHLRSRRREAAGGGARLPVDRVAIGEGGRLVIPAAYRQALGLKDGDEVLLQLAQGELRLLTPKEAVRRAQILVRRYVPAGRSLAGELIKERRQEARRE